MQILKASIINPTNDRLVEYEDLAGIVISENIIVDCGKFDDISGKYPNADIIDYSDYVITPGFIDLHTHIPQYPAIGQGKGELLPWLEDYIFPLEMKFADFEYAYKLSKIFFNKAISYGTTTMSAYSSLHFLGTLAAIKAGIDTGVNLYIGKTMMDTGAGDYKHSVNQNIDDTKKLIQYVKDLSCDNIHYVVTPRYAGSCSIQLLREAAKIAEDNDLHIQTHLSENMKELEYIASLHPDYNSYTEVYQETGILSSKTLLAHCIYLSEHELSILKESGSNVIHCPSSNRYLMSGRMNFAGYDKLGLNIGLGTDVAAGYSLSMANEMREAIETSGDMNLFDNRSSNHVKCGNNLNELTSASRVFYAATLGAADILGNNQIGRIEKGRNADLLLHKLYDKSDLNYALNQIIYGISKLEKVYIRGIEKTIL